MPDVGSFARFHSLLRWRKPASMIGVVGALAFVLWTLPNWGTFWENARHFPGLWQVPGNRRAILYLMIKILSPLLIMGITGIIVWMYQLINVSEEREAMGSVYSEHAQPGARDERRMHSHPSSSEREQIPERQRRSSSAPICPSPGSPGYNPETPLPPTSLFEQALNIQRENAENTSERRHPTISEQRRETTPMNAETPFRLTPSDLAPAPIESSLLASTKPPASSEPLISIRLLKDVSLIIHVPGGGHVVVPLTLNAKRVQLLAYIAWRRGEFIDRDKILEQVFGWGLSDEEATEDKLSERFESHKKLLRKKIREVVIEQINKPAGRPILDPDQIDPFVSNSGFWGLSAQCRVDDLEVIETNAKIISLARKDGKLVDEIPEEVREACEQVMAHYAGDFLEALIKKFPGEFRPWQGHSSWARKPYTHYRDLYLEALWYAAEYEWRMGQRAGDDGTHLGEAGPRTQQEYFGKAAEYYQSYAMYACNSRFDAKATFGAHGEYGERVGMSERALRRCVVLLGAIGKTHLIHQVWSAYTAHMKSISDHRWQPSKATQADIDAAREQTNAYRFAAQLSHLNDFAAPPDRVVS